MDLHLIPLQLHKDARGFVLNPFDEIQAPAGDVRSFHVCSLNKGAVRGNHYHENGEEYILFLGGDFRLVTEDMATGERVDRHFGESDGRLMKINRKVAHAIRNEGEEPLYLLCFYVLKDPVQIDTIRHQII